MARELPHQKGNSTAFLFHRSGINFIVEAVKRFNLQNKGITITFNPDLHISDVISNNRAEGCRVQIIISENFSNDKLHNN